jgi:uncharacterized protein (DUF1501 family)
MATAPVLNTAFDTSSSLAMQLRMVARLISVRQALGVQRQVFFVSLGGFDLHDFLVAQHPGLLAQLASALRSFHDATTEMGVSQQVTAFTASDFGRTFSSNGDGSDHGWGSHHFVLGGAAAFTAATLSWPSTAPMTSARAGCCRPLPSISWPPHWRVGWA